jgi:hypothetical protein
LHWGTSIGHISDDGCIFLPAAPHSILKGRTTRVLSIGRRLISVNLPLDLPAVAQAYEFQAGRPGT